MEKIGELYWGDAQRIQKNKKIRETYEKGGDNKC